MPRFVLLLKANADSESSAVPSQACLEAMTTYNESLVSAGVMLSGEGLTSSKDGYRVHIGTSSPPAVTKGPFANSSGDMVAGWWVLKTTSAEEAVEWAKKIPTDCGEVYVEIRKIGEDEDMGEGYTEELKEREEKIREKIGEKKWTSWYYILQIDQGDLS